MKSALLIIGTAVCIVGAQDTLRLLINSQSGSIFGWIPGGFALHLALGVAFVIIGGMLARYASGMPESPSK